MTNPRSEALAAVIALECEVECLPAVLTVGAIERHIAAQVASAQALRRLFEWMDAIETP